METKLKDLIILISFILISVWLMVIAIISLDSTLEYQESKEDSYRQQIELQQIENK